MIIKVLDDKLKIIDILRKYTFCQYTDKARSIGSFKINVRLLQENLYFLEKNKDFYVLFDDNIIGKIERIKKESDSETEQVIELTGVMCSVVFKKRIINGTVNFSGQTYAAITELIRLNMISSKDVNRNIAITQSYKDVNRLKKVCSSITKQYTGGYVWNSMEELLEQDKLCFDFIPKVEDLHSPNGVTFETHISKWSFILSAGVDRTKGNADGNKPVVFSQSLSNIERTEYDKTNENYCNVAYIAGEGEGTDRKWFEMNINGESTAQPRVGLNRNELWIDARDIQSEDTETDKVLTDAEYKKLIEQRANEKASESNREESYGSTLTEANKQYKFGIDYFKGDFVTVIDDELNVSVNAQIVEVTKTVQDSREIVDIVFEYGKINREPLKQLEDMKDKIEESNNSAKYLEVKTVLIEKDTRKEIEKVKANILSVENELTRKTTYINGAFNELSEIVAYVSACPGFACSGKILLNAKLAPPAGATWYECHMSMQNPKGSQYDVSLVIIATTANTRDTYTAIVNGSDSTGYTIQWGLLESLFYKNSYWGLSDSNSDVNWLRTTANGLIPWSSEGNSSLGTTSWNFHSIYGKTLFEGNVPLHNKYLLYKGAITNTKLQITAGGIYSIDGHYITFKLHNGAVYTQQRWGMIMVVPYYYSQIMILDGGAVLVRNYMGTPAGWRDWRELTNA